MRRIFLVGAVVSFVLGYYLAVKGTQDKFAVADRSKTETGRYICWNKKNFEKKPGQQISTMAVSLMTALDAEEIKPLEGINGYSFKTQGEVEARFRALDTSDEWVIQKEYVHHAFFGASPVQTKCYQSAGPLVEVACPTPAPEPTPNPSPTPSPAPNPNPVEQDRSWGRTRVHAKEAQALVDTSKVTVGIVDTGLDTSHVCVGKVIATKSFTGEPVSPDVGQHGTHVAGTVAGKCGVGISQAGIVFGKGLMNNGSGSSGQLASAVQWVCSQNIQVASFSWGSPQQDPLINQAISFCTQKGIAVAIANGNDSRGQLNWPAALSQSNPLVFGIAASDQNDRKANFSSYGPGTKFIAPGVDIVSNKPGGGFQAMSGTSMATPTVAGALTFCAALKKPFQSCLRTDDLGLGVNAQGAGLPRLDLTVK